MSAVASRNPFDLLSDETPAAPAATPKSAETPKTDAPSARGGQRGRSGPASRGGRYYQRGGAAGSAPREQAETTEDAPREGKRLSEERGRGRGRGGRGRGDRGDRGRAGGHGRPFDKHSMTGKTDSEKKINQGWGADEGDKELKAEEEGFKDAAAEAPANDPWATDAAPAAADDAWGTPAVETSGDAAKDAAPAEARRNREEEEDNTLTLDQYLAQQKEKITVPKLENVRKANDGDDGLFKDAVQVLKDNEDDVYFAAKTKAAKQRAKKEDKKQVIEIDGQFSDRQTRGGRGGRGGDRGGGRGGDRGGDRGARGGGRGRGGRGRGRGEFQGANGSNRPVNVDDQTAFPSLS